MEGNTKVLRKRHLAKAISYRIFGTAITILIAWVFTDNFELSLKFGIGDVILKTLFYYLHERVWYKYFKFGVKYK